MFRKIILTVAMSVFAVAALIPANTTTAQNNREMAMGHGSLLRVDEDGNTVRRQFSFNAQRRNDGTVTGKAVLHNPAFEGANGQNYQATMNISCMKLYPDNIAVFGGTIRRTNDPNLVDTAFFAVQDNGEPGGGVDRITGLVFWDDNPMEDPGDPQVCEIVTLAELGTLELIETGNIQVRP